VARSVLALCEDWNRLCVQNLAGVVTWLQTRGKSGRFEVEAFGTRGTIFLQDGELVEARWKELEGREVVRFFAEELPDSGFRFAEAAGLPDDRALEVPHAPAALEVPHAPAVLGPGAPTHPAATPFGEIYTAVVRIDLGSDSRLRRTGIGATAFPGPVTAPTVAGGNGVVGAGNGILPAGNGVEGEAQGSAGAANGGPEGESVSPGPGKGAVVTAVMGVTAPLNDAAGPANRVAAQSPHDPPGPRLVPSGTAPRRPTALVRAISRAEREALLTGTYPSR
jgi:hypothetical protein